MDRDNWDKSDEGQDAMLINEEEVSIFFWVISSKEELWVEFKEKDEELNEWHDEFSPTECFFCKDGLNEVSLKAWNNI